MFPPKLKRRILRALCSVCLLFTSSAAMAANPFVHPLFSSHMVLQRDASDPVWGWTTAGNTVTVVVKDQTNAALQTKTATAGSDGRWEVSVGPFALVPGNAAYSMTVTAPGQTTQNFTDILIGDVWLCTGQSNMDFAMSAMGTNGTYNMANDIADSANYPTIREFHVNDVSVNTPQVTVPAATWTVAGPSTTGSFSATGYFTARAISKQQGIPVGILHSAWAGTEIKLWLDAGTISEFGDLRQPYFDQTTIPSDLRDLYAGAYNGMIAPLAPLSFKAIIWYQGEYNYDRPEQYGRLLPALISQWRTLFARPTLPFLIVQLPNTDAYAQIRQSQLDTVRNDPNTRLVVTNDIGESTLHPPDKEDVGLRAAWAANDLVYGKTGPTGAPLFTGATVSGNTIRCAFSNVGGGLMVGRKTINQSGAQTPVQQLVGGTLNGFTIAGSNRSYVTATATIDPATNTVVVSAPSVSSPLYVRYAWTAASAGNLYAKVTDSGGNVVEGNPASPFTNDPSIKLSVNNGNGSATTTLGSHPSITAPANTGETFDHWSGDASALASPTSAATTATISKNYTSVYANYLVTGAPANLTTSSAVAGQITLSWNAMTAVHYNIKRSSTAGGTYVPIATGLVGVTSYTDTSVTPGATYYYILSATSVLGDGPDSSPYPVVVPAGVTGLTVVGGSALVSLNWATTSGAISYNVKRATTSGGPYTTIASGTSATSYLDRAVVSGQTYYYLLTAITGSGESVPSKEIAAIPSFLPPPLVDADIGTVAVPGGAFANTAGAYTLVASGTGFGGASNSCNFAYSSTSISGDFTLTARITSLGTGSPEVGIMACSSLDSTAPFVRTYVTTTQTCYQGRGTAGATPGTSVTTSSSRWVRIVRTGTSYRGWVSADGSTWATQGTAVSFSGSPFIGLFATSKSSSAVTVTFDNLTLTPNWALQVPATPTGLKAVTTPGSNQAVLSWNAAAGAATYDVKRATTSGGPYTTIATGLNATTFTATGLTSGTTYYYVVSANDSVGASANSAPAVVDLTAPVVTANNVTAQATSSAGANVTFSTSAVDDIDGALSTTNSPASGSSFPVGTTSVTASATDQTGNTGTKVFTVTVVWPTPANLAATALSETQIQLSWNANSANNAPFVIQRSPRGANSWTTLTSNLPAGATSYIDATAAASTEYDYRIQSTGSGVSSAFASLSTSTPAGIGDGIPGAWRYQYFGNGTTVIPSSAAHADPDSDGMDNLQEYLCGTIPTDSASVLRTSVTFSGSDVLVTFPSVSGKTYLLQRTSDLGAGPWTTIQDNISGTGANITLTDPGVTDSPRFYRIELK